MINLMSSQLSDLYSIQISGIISTLEERVSMHVVYLQTAITTR